MKKETINILTYAYKSGNSLIKLSKKYNIPKTTIYYHLSKLNVIRRQNRLKNLKTDDNIFIGTFIGLWVGDGSKFRDNLRYVIKIHFHKGNIQFIQFIKNIIKELLGLNVIVYKDGGNKASIKIYSKFVYYFIENYLGYNENKTLTVHLKRNLSNHQKEFLEGFLLGLALSDGSISGNRFTYATISENLKNNVIELLLYFDYNPRVYLHNRKKYGWHDLYLISLRKQERERLIMQLNNTLTNLGTNQNFPDLK